MSFSGNEAKRQRKFHDKQYKSTIGDDYEAMRKLKGEWLPWNFIYIKN